jgi:hypothetical protein
MGIAVALLRRAGTLLLLFVVVSFAGVVKGGQGVWTSGGPAAEVGFLAIDPLNPATLYAGTDRGVFKSTDSGGTWVAANVGLTALYITSLAVDPVTPSTLYAGTLGDVVFKSTNSGGTWFAANEGLAGLTVRCLAVNPASPSTLYAGTNGSGVFKSTDSGGTWVAANQGLTALYIMSLAVNPASPSTLYAGTNGSGVFKSTDSGGTWAASSTGLTPNVYAYALAIDPVTPTTLYAQMEGAVFKSTDSAATWTATGLINNWDPAWTYGAALAIDPGTPNTLYAGGNGVSRSTDSGAIWTAVNAGLQAYWVYALAIHPATPTTLFAGTSNGVWLLSNPGGGPTFLIPSGAHLPGANGAFYSTNVSVSNNGVAPLSFTMKFLGHDQDGSAGPEQTFNLESGRSVTYFDVLSTVFGQTSNYGAVRITSDQPPLNVVSVTSTPGFRGTLSQTVPAVRTSDLIPASSPRSILYIRDGDGFRTNLVLASSASVPTNVDVFLISPEGVTLAAKTYAVPPNGMTQINRIVHDMGIWTAVTGARLVLSSSTPGAAFTAFASVIDEVTNDPTTVEAR